MSEENKVLGGNQDNISLEEQLKKLDEQRQHIVKEMLRQKSSARLEMLNKAILESDEALRILNKYDLKKNKAFSVFLSFVDEGFRAMEDACDVELELRKQKRELSDAKRKATREKNMQQKSEQSKQVVQTVEVDADAFGSDEGIDSYSHSVEREETPSW